MDTTPPNRFWDRLLVPLLFLTYVLIVWGAVVRGSGSGLGCPDWPLCFGQIIPPFRKDVLIEYFHRLLASVVGLLTLGVSFVVWRQPKWRKKLGKTALMTLVLLFVQIFLGGIAVRSELHPHVVAAHLGVALIFLTLLFRMLLKTRSVSSPAFETKNKTFVFILVPLLFLQIILGGLVAASEAGLACPDFPTCQGVWVPMIAGGVALHFSHRILALVILAMVFYLALTQWRSFIVKIIFLLVVVQISLGIGVVLLGLPLWMRVAHNGVAVLLFLSLVVRSYEYRRLSPELY